MLGVGVAELSKALLEELGVGHYSEPGRTSVYTRRHGDMATGENILSEPACTSSSMRRCPCSASCVQASKSSRSDLDIVLCQ